MLPAYGRKTDWVLVDELSENLARLERLDSPYLAEGMQRAANVAVTLMKANHPAPPASGSLYKGHFGYSLATKHDHQRFYTRSGKLVNSMRAGETKVETTKITQEVLAGDQYVNYAAPVELGGPNRRAYPYMAPAIIDPAVMQQIANAVTKALQAEAAKG